MTFLVIENQRNYSIGGVIFIPCQIRKKSESLLEIVNDKKSTLNKNKTLSSLSQELCFLWGSE